MRAFQTSRVLHGPCHFARPHARTHSSRHSWHHKPRYRRRNGGDFPSYHHHITPIITWRGITRHGAITHRARTPRDAAPALRYTTHAALPGALTTPKGSSRAGVPSSRTAGVAVRAPASVPPRRAPASLTDVARACAAFVGRAAPLTLCLASYHSSSSHATSKCHCRHNAAHGEPCMRSQWPQQPRWRLSRGPRPRPGAQRPRRASTMTAATAPRAGAAAAAFAAVVSRRSGPLRHFRPPRRANVRRRR